MGNSLILFYYRDQSGHAVGPLPLSEIKRFVAAGVLNADVLVREASSNDWIPLVSALASDEIPVATMVSDSSSLASPASPRFKRLRNRIARKNKKELLGCVVGQIIYLTLLFIFLKFVGWILQRFMPPLFPNGIF